MRTKTTIALAATLLLSLATTQIFAQCGGPDPKRNIVSAAGRASELVKADTAYIILFVRGGGVLLTDARKQLDEKTQVVVNAVNENRKGKIKEIQSDLVKIGDVPRNFGPVGDNKECVEMYKRLVVETASDAALANEILDAASRAGAAMSIRYGYDSGVAGNVVFALKNSDKVEEALLKAAYKNAVSDAEKTAALAGRKIGQVVSVGTNKGHEFFGAGYQDFMRPRSLPKFKGSDPDKIFVEIMVNATFELKD